MRKTNNKKKHYFKIIVFSIFIYVLSQKLSFSRPKKLNFDLQLYASGKIFTN